MELRVSVGALVGAEDDVDDAEGVRVTDNAQHLTDLGANPCGGDGAAHGFREGCYCCNVAGGCDETSPRSNEKQDAEKMETYVNAETSNNVLLYLSAYMTRAILSLERNGHDANKDE
ncbi:2-C-methyl-D-erythritol 2,4-cyclodiphosphate synthase [Striga asiatica]|uniref:2-C-methyl-D-erythritol 2,4-cyclodiphosphate synthase n=1 Tax=Striga asiatica TaxID=4170 RepID=A0A5A7P265_STRAF|nr:2-C-methyl-D-erythritol 2,4-cyclodiphosphate synthase [Striga asiatica]